MAVQELGLDIKNAFCSKCLQLLDRLQTSIPDVLLLTLHALLKWYRDQKYFAYAGMPVIVYPH